MATRDLEYKISAKDRTKRAFRGVTKGLNSMRKSLFNFKTAMVAVAGIAGFGLMIRATLKTVDANKKLADRLGLTTQQLAGYEYASVLAGESVETVQNAFQKLSKNIYEASRNLGTAVYGLEKLNLKARDLLKLTLDEQIKVISDKLAGLGTQAEKLGVASQIFGRAGIVMINMLEQGGAALTKLQEEALMLGIALTTASAKGVEDFNDSLARLKFTFKGIANSITAELAPAMQGITDRLTELMKTFIKEEGMRAFFDEMYGLIQRTIIALTSFAISFLQVFKAIALTVNKGLFGDRFFDSEKFDAMINKMLVSISDVTNARLQAILDYKKAQEEASTLEDKLNEDSTQTIVSRWEDTFLQLSKLRESSMDMVKGFDSLAVAISNGFGKAFEDIIMGTKKAGEAFKDLGRLIYAQIIKMLVMRMIVAPFTNAFGNFMTEMGIPEMKQFGGKVTAGKPYIVGEAGRELFVPNQSGSIVPNNKLGATVIQNISISTGVAATVRSEILSLLPAIAEVSKGAVMDSELRGQS